AHTPLFLHRARYFKEASTRPTSLRLHGLQDVALRGHRGRRRRVHARGGRLRRRPAGRRAGPRRPRHLRRRRPVVVVDGRRRPLPGRRAPLRQPAPLMMIKQREPCCQLTVDVRRADIGLVVFLYVFAPLISDDDDWSVRALYNQLM
uniref:Uncharacterized protein n=1 Tax=Triticum urartu TaxID=4572 RepID=A0A8R7K400_TRIUA